jgi:hypothetical protein
MRAGEAVLRRAGVGATFARENGSRDPGTPPHAPGRTRTCWGVPGTSRTLATPLSVYLGKDAILEVGTWTEDAGGAIETTLTGQLDQEYETPVTASYTRDGDGLTDGTFRLHPLQVITPADIEAMMSPTGTYVSKLYPAADAPGKC